MSRFFAPITLEMVQDPRHYFQKLAETLLVQYPGVKKQDLSKEASAWYVQCVGQAPQTQLEWCQALTMLRHAWLAQTRSIYGG